jgi:CheY-like chemotaxis protein
MPEILVVEDEPAIAELVRRRLDEEGYAVTLARSGPKALELAAARRFDLVLMDINLGKFSPDGFAVNGRLKADPATAPIPVIALTAHAQQVEHRERALREGFVEHVTKPIDFDLLLEKIAASLDPGETAR